MPEEPPVTKASGREVSRLLAVLTGWRQLAEQLLHGVVADRESGERDEGADREVADDRDQLVVTEDAAGTAGLVGAHGVTEERAADGIGETLLEGRHPVERYAQRPPGDVDRGAQADIAGGCADRDREVAGLKHPSAGPVGEVAGVEAERD